MKYQIVLEGPDNISDGELEEQVKMMSLFPLVGFEVLYVNNITYFREELKVKQEKIVNTFSINTDIETMKSVESTFEEIEELFKL